MHRFLSAREVAILTEAHRAARTKRHADRIKTILLLNQGFSYAEITRILLLDDSTLREYAEEYRRSGVDGLLEDHYRGGVSRLSPAQEQSLITRLDEQVYLSVKEIARVVEHEFGLTYTIEGLTHLLHRLGFVYKKMKRIPGKADPMSQQAFLTMYDRLKKTKKPEDQIYFLDATHPHHNSLPSYGWIRKGTIKPLLANTGRKRLNLNGALNLEGLQAVVRQEPTIDADAVIRLLVQLETKQPAGQLYVILDNARYHHAKKVRAWLKKHRRFTFLFLPSYAPNLNLIERLWLLFQKKILYNRYYATFDQFQRQCLGFFAHLDDYRVEMETLLADRFQVIGVPADSET